MDSARKSFKLFKPFYEATTSYASRVSSAYLSVIPIENSFRSNHPSIVAIKKNIIHKYHEYRRAMDDSVKTAQSGHTFAKEGVDLCDFIKEEKDDASITSFLKDMHAFAHKAHTMALETSEKFRRIRQSLFEVSLSYYDYHLTQSIMKRVRSPSRLFLMLRPSVDEMATHQV